MSTPQNLYSQSAGQVSSADFLSVIQQRDPTSADSHYPVGKRWINESSNAEWVMTSKSTIGGVVTAHWESSTTLSGGAPISKYIVDADGSADYTTIQAAINAANSAGVPATVYVRPGTYTENLTLVSTIDVVGSIFSGVTITGVHTPPASGRFTFQNVTLTSATHIFSSAVAGSATLIIEDAVVTVTNGYVFSLLNWTGSLIISDTDANGTNDGIVNNTGGATVILHDSTLGVGTGNSMVASGGVVQILETQVGCPVTFGGAGTVTVDAGCTFTRTITTANTAAVTITNCNLSTGAIAAISHGSAGALELSNVVIDSSANPVLAGAGAGVLTMTGVSFSNASNLAGTLTTAAGRIRGGNFPSQYVVGTSPDAQYQTIQAAITAAAAAGGNATVIVKPGTYTENLTLSSTVDIMGTVFSGVTITGVHTPPASGRVTIQNCTLTSATHIFSSAVAGSTTLVVEDCVVTVTNGYVFSLLNWTGSLIISETDANGTNDGIVNNTGGATVILHASTLGVGTGNSMVASGGVVQILETQIDCPVTFGGAGTVTIDAGCSFSRTVTTANSAAVTVTASNFFTGSTAAISHGSSGVLNLADVSISSTAIPVISGSGAGVITAASVTFLSGRTIASTLTVAGSNAASGGTLQTGALIQTFPNTFLTFKSSPLLTTAATTAGAATGATGDTNLMCLQGGEIMEQFILGAGQTIIGPRMSTTGLLTSLDLTASEGAEYNFGVNATNKHAYTIGTSPAFFIELSVNAADVGGLDPFVVGFRKQQANDATFTNYTDFATIGARATTAADVVVLQTNLNGGGAVITNTTDAWTDGQTKVFRVNVSSAGVVTYTINGAAPTVTAAFTFDNTDVVMPFVRHLFGAATPGAINWISLKIGYQ